MYSIQSIASMATVCTPAAGSAGRIVKARDRIAVLMLPFCSGVLPCAVGTPKALYGFEPSQLVGRPLSAALDVFGHWRHHFGEDGSLLTLLAEHTMNDAVQGGGSSSTAAGPSWRVGVHLPVKNDADIAAHAAVMAADTHFTQVRHQHTKQFHPLKTCTA
jgi:hypothetical protein